MILSLFQQFLLRTFKHYYNQNTDIIVSCETYLFKQEIFIYSFWKIREDKRKHQINYYGKHNWVNRTTS